MVAREIAGELLRIGALEIRPDPDCWFTWSSGRRAPIYCDNRRIISYPNVRALVARALADSIKQHHPQVEVIAGTATAGIPHAAWVAELLELPMVYVRGGAKGHGQGKQVEGRPLEGEAVVLVEDLVSFGGSAKSAVEALRAEAGKVLGVQSIVTYGFPAARRCFEKLGVPLHSLVTYDDLLDQMELDASQRRALEEWRECTE